MSDHLPECDTLFFREMVALRPLDSESCRVCDAFRACEQRKDAEHAEAWERAKFDSVMYAAGVQAARDTVAAWVDHNSYPNENWDRLLADIDGCKPKGADDGE